MRKLLLLLAGFSLFALQAHAQANQNNFGGSSSSCITTVSKLSSSCGTKAGTIASVTDGTTSTDCTTGGGSNTVACQYNGTVWAALGGLPTGAVTSQIVQSGLVAQYDFNEGSGTVLTDVSGNGNNGTLCASTAAPTWNAVNAGGGLVFNAANAQCVTLPSALNGVKTWQIYMTHQIQATGTSSATYPFVIVGNGTAANSAGVGFVEGFVGGTAFPNNTSVSPLEPGIRTYGGASQVSTLSGFTGTGMLTWALDNSTDQIYINGFGPLATPTNGHSQGTQTAGVYQFGGRPFFINGNNSWWTGTIFYALAYSTELTAAQIIQNYNAVQQIMNNRGVNITAQPPANLANQLPFGLGTNLAGNILVSRGDSEDAASNGYFGYMAPSNTSGAWSPILISQSGAGAPPNPFINGPSSGSYSLEQINTCQFVAPNGFSVIHEWFGANTLGSAGFINSMMQASRMYRGCGFKTVLGSNMDATSHDAGKNTNNQLMRQYWPTMVDAFADIGASPSMGADGASTNLTFFADGLHPTAVGQNIVGAIWQRSLNREILGANDFTSGSTYTTTAPAAATITAASESGNTATFTFSATPATFIVGADVYITGVTPAGYNTTSADTICHVLTSTATTITCLNVNSGLGAGTVFGVASVATQLDTDGWVTLAGSATSPAFTLETCQGLTGSLVHIKNSNTTSPWVIKTQSQASGAYATETIDGAATLTMPTASSGNFPVIVLQDVGLSTTTGGCVWERLQ
jgi:hypothetical protein